MIKPYRPGYHPPETLRHGWQGEIFDELIIDNFAGGGGASTGIEWALKRPVDHAINHDPVALSMHKTNHPFTLHHIADVFEVDPKQIVAGRNVGLAWFSPDCRHHSRAKGAKPVDKKIRGLAWVALKWAGQVRPRIIILENVPEFLQWNTTVAARDTAGNVLYNPDGSMQMRSSPKKKGKIFRRFVSELIKLGYNVDWRVLSACDYGAPTSRKRLFLIARCDGAPIVFPKPTHGTGKIPHRSAAECIDWTIPTSSIFNRRSELRETTLRRIARGIGKFILSDPQPFLLCQHLPFISTYHNDKAGAKTQSIRGLSLNQPLATQSTENRFALISSYISKFNQHSIGNALSRPLETIVASATRFSLISAVVIKHFGGNYNGCGSSIKSPLPTITAWDHNAVAVAHIQRNFGNSIGHRITEPLGTITAGADKSAIVKSILNTSKHVKNHDFSRQIYELIKQLAPDYLSQLDHESQNVGVFIGAERHVITDIHMRMLDPKELFAAQGFDNSYVIAPYHNGKKISKKAQIRMVGNSVCPQIAEALVKANYFLKTQERVLT